MFAALAAFLGTAPAAETAPIPVTLAEVKLESWRAEVQLTGTSIALQRSELSPRVEGLVTELFVDEGTEVAPGDPILALDRRLAEIDRDSAQARVLEAEARHRDAIRVRDEFQRLREGRHASKADIESAMAQVEISAAVLEGTRADLARATEVLERHRLNAPFAGMIVAKQVEIGEWVQRDAAAVELVAMDRLRVRATLPQRDYVRVSRGAPARLVFDALPDRTFDGEVAARVALGDERTRSFPLLIDLPNPDHMLASGMSTRVQVTLDGSDAEVTTVPRDAIVVKSDGTREVWRVRFEDGGSPQAWPVVVTVDGARGDRVAVQGDLSAGEPVVLLGNEGLKPGQAVRPQGEDAHGGARLGSTEPR